MQRFKCFYALVAAFVVTASAASAKPNVQLKLDGELVQHDAKGDVKLVPLASAELKTGQTVRYDIVATNQGTDPAAKLMPVGKIPSGTAYEAGSASSATSLRVEFSIDGGKTWAKSPTIKVTTPTGVVVKPADPSSYTTIRWIAAKPLAPKASLSYSYEVRLK